MELVCLSCRSSLERRESSLECHSCARSWPILHGLPVLVDDLAAYVRGTVARFHVDRSEAFGPFAKAAEAGQKGGPLSHPQHAQRLNRLAGAVRQNYELFEQLHAPVQALVPADMPPLEEADLAVPTGYGPEAATEFLLRDWRRDSREALEWTSAVLPVDHVERAVVLGSGAGRTLSVLAGAAREVVGVELSFPLALSADLLLRGERLQLHEVRLRNVHSSGEHLATHELFSGRDHPNVATVVADALHTPLADAGVDWLVAAFLFDVLPDGRTLLQEARRLLRPGGTFALLTVFNYQHDNLWTYYAPDEVLELVREEGFRLRDATWVDSTHLASPFSIKESRYRALRILAEV